ncbi:ArgE/DapE family deacylase [Candidatus Collierbacteria bacterium]|nr:ArgE/DapE family deacylase [Candidatus Collierbacteria bacterium]
MKRSLLQQGLIDITSKLIAFNTVTPFGNETTCAPYISKLLKELNMKVKVLAKKKNRANVIGEIGSGKKSLVIACHMDTVEFGKGWKITDPLKPAIKNGRIYGRGAVDDKGPFAVAYCAVKKFIQKHPAFDGKIYLVAMADEEDDNIYGAKFLLQKGFKADAGLMIDGGYLNSFDYGEKGCIQIKIESFGKQEHSGLQEHGQNAVENLIDLISILKNDLKFEKFDKRFTPLHLNTSLITGGEMANSIPAYAFGQMDIRFPLGISSKEVIGKIEMLVKSTSGTNKKFKISILYATEPHVVESHELITSFKKAAKMINLPMKAITIGGNSVAKEFTQAGIPSIVHVPASVYTAHEPDEYISIKEMGTSVKLYVAFFEKYFTTK